MAQQDEWFSAWFDSPYYHILYNNRNASEAQQFMDNLLAYLHPKPHDKILDLACGKGRHSVYLNQKGYDVTGIDLSEHSIAYARQFENKHLHFAVHDMRQVYSPETFDFILNLFTSFGYFDNETENVVALVAMAQSLKYGGKLVIDFMNTDLSIATLVKEEEKVVQGITFKIHRGIEKDFITKTISFTDQGRDYSFIERVRVLRKKDFLEYFAMGRLRLMETFGDYDLSPYQRDESERMIFVLKK